MTIIQEIKYFSVAVCGGGLFLVFCLLALPEHLSLLEVDARLAATQVKSQARLSANEYITQMGPWNKPVKIKEASAEPLK